MSWPSESHHLSLQIWLLDCAHTTQIHLLHMRLGLGRLLVNMSYGLYLVGLLSFQAYHGLFLFWSHRASLRERGEWWGGQCLASIWVCLVLGRLSVLCVNIECYSNLWKACFISVLLPHWRMEGSPFAWKKTETHLRGLTVVDFSY